MKGACDGRTHKYTQVGKAAPGGGRDIEAMTCFDEAQLFVFLYFNVQCCGTGLILSVL
jgi:hypothetical protein